LIDRAIGRLKPDRKAGQLRISSCACQFRICDFGWKGFVLVPGPCGLGYAATLPPSEGEAVLRLRIKCAHNLPHAQAHRAHPKASACQISPYCVAGELGPGGMGAMG